MNSVFFKEGILTSTSANYLADLAKERCKVLEEKLHNLQPYKKTVQLIGSDKEGTLSYGNFPSNIEEIIDKISQYKAFIAWVREALKAKANLAFKIREYDIEIWATENDIILPVCPRKGKVLTEAEYYESLSIKERMEYFYLETVCSQIGKAIHENGCLSNARIDLAKVINEPISMGGNGRDTCIYTKTPIVTQSEVDELYFKLQTKHREHQARLNAIKHKCELALEESATSCLNNYNSRYELYKKDMQTYENQYNSFLIEEGAKVRNLKIAIPNALESIYQELNSITKD